MSTFESRPRGPRLQQRLSVVGTITAAVLATSLTMRTAGAGPAGELDATFGDYGRVTIGDRGWVGIGLLDGGSRVAVVEQTDGKLVISGALWTISRKNFAVLRLNADGSLDEQFGTGGITAIDFYGGDDYATDIAVRGDGKIIVVGAAGTSEGRSKLAIAQMNPDGKMDATFGDAGRVTLGGAAFASAIELTPDGRILVVGATANYDVVFARFNADGTLDTSFGTGPLAGTTVIDAGDLDEPADLLRQPDGKYLACGSSQVNELVYTGHMLAIRINADGSPDGGFGNNGVVEPAPAALYSAAAEACAVLGDGTIVLGGFDLLVPGYPSATLLRLRPDGNVDTAYWDAGIAAVGPNSNVQSLAVLGGGELVAAGFTNLHNLYGSSLHDMYVARLDPVTGVLDNEFGDNGITTIDFGTRLLVANSDADDLIALSSGKLLAVGTAVFSEGWDSWGKTVVARLNRNGPGSAGVVGFMQQDRWVREDAGEVTVEVRRTGGSTGVVAVDYQTFDAVTDLIYNGPGALAPGDYTPTSGTLTWMDGDLTRKTITVQIVNDGYKDSNEDEQFQIQLMANPQSQLGLATRQTTLWIEEDRERSGPVMAGWTPRAQPAGGGGSFDLAMLLLLTGARTLRRAGGVGHYNRVETASPHTSVMS